MPRCLGSTCLLECCSPVHVPHPPSTAGRPTLGFALSRAVSQAPFKVQAQVETWLVLYGNSIWINCSTTCKDPSAMGDVETSLAKRYLDMGPGWLAVELHH